MVIYLTREERIARRRGLTPPPTVEHTGDNGEHIVVVSPSTEVDVPTEQVEVKPAKKRKTKKEKETKEDEV